MSKLRIVTFAILLLVVAVGCSSSDQAAIDKAVSATLAAAQPATAATTATSTPEPVPTSTPTPESTKVPTPKPVPTPEPTKVPTPKPVPKPVPTPEPSTSGDFKDAKTVAQSIDKQQITACQVQLFEILDANSGIRCKLADDSYVEIYTFDNDAKNSCEASDWCKSLTSDGSSELRTASGITFFDNVILMAVETEDIVADIQDGTVSSSEINMVSFVDDVSDMDESEVEELIRLAKNSDPIEIDIDDLIDLAHTNALAADEYTYKLITTKGIVVAVGGGRTDDQNSIFTTGLRRAIESMEFGTGVWDGFHCVYPDNLKDSANQLRPASKI